MAKSLLILMLVTAQFLSGSGGSFCLCISGDGSFCIDAGAGACSSCKVICGSGCNTTCDASTKSGDASRCRTHENDRSMRLTLETPTAEGSCDCTHIPVMVPSSPPTRVGRSSVSVDFERLSLLVAQVTVVDVAYVQVPPSSIHCCEVSAIPNFTLTVISKVNIRC